MDAELVSDTLMGRGMLGAGGGWGGGGGREPWDGLVGVVDLMVGIWIAFSLAVWMALWFSQVAVNCQ